MKSYCLQKALHHFTVSFVFFSFQQKTVPFVSNEKSIELIRSLIIVELIKKTNSKFCTWAVVSTHSWRKRVKNTFFLQNRALFVSGLHNLQKIWFKSIK